MKVLSAWFLEVDLLIFGLLSGTLLNVRSQAT